MPISYVDDVTTTSTSSSTSYTITKPSNVTSGDFLIAGIAHHSSSGSQVTVTPPTGWTLVDDAFASGTQSVQLSILTRVAGTSEPSSWNGSFSGARSIKVQMCVAYRGAFGLVDDTATRTIGSATSYSVGPVSNPSATNHRILIAAYGSSSNNYTITSNEVRYVAFGTVDPGTAIEAAMWDSNGTVSTGNHSRTVSRGAIWGTSAGWIGILSASAGEDIEGDLVAALPSLSASMAGSLGYDASMAVTLPLPTMTASGIASPPEGPLDVLVLPEVSVEAAHHAAGTLDVLAGPIVQIAGETRRFGIRVVTPESESRVIRPRLGAVD